MDPGVLEVLVGLEVLGARMVRLALGHHHVHRHRQLQLVRVVLGVRLALGHRVDHLHQEYHQYRPFREDHQRP